MSDEKRPLGRILLQRKLVSQQELDAALRAQKREAVPSPIASHLVAQGAVQEIEALRALSEQYGVPGIDLGQVGIVLDHLNVVPREVAESSRVLPVLVRGDRIFLAAADPTAKRVIDELEFVTGKTVFPYVAVHTTLVKTIEAAYDAKERGERHFLGPRVSPETLRQLGLSEPPPPAPTQATDAPATTDRDPRAESLTPEPAQPPASVTAPPATPPPTPPAAPPAAAAKPPPPPRVRSAMPAPPVRAVVVEEAVAAASRGTDISTTDFGKLDGEVSSVDRLPTDLRQDASVAAGAISGQAGKLVLIVDDDDDIRKLLKRLLVQNGRRVLEAERGLLALRLVKEHVPDLIVLDAMLPELHGFDIARRIKGSAKYGNIPVIMMSAVYKGWRIAEDLKQNYGIEEFIEKPFRLAEVVELVDRLLARADGKSLEARDPESLSEDADQALREGIEAYKAGNVDPAIEHLKRGISIDPLSYRLHFHLALLYGKKGQVFEGIQELERAIDLNPRHFPALKNLAVLYEKAGFKNKAVELWERCVTAAPDDTVRTSVRQHLRELI